jgi:N-acetylglucosaminyl-diphospho-decaprenol L-rhamnosyltransferase
MIQSSDAPQEFDKLSLVHQTKEMKLLVVIVNYRVAHLTIDCLRSLAEEIERIPEARVAVCENGTGDDSAERIQRAIDDHGWGKWCTLTAISPNLGFTGGNNVVLRPALQSPDPPQYVLLLNADTVIRQNALKSLVEFMDEHPNVGIAGSRLEGPDGTLQASAFRFVTPISEFESSINFGPISRLLHRWRSVPPMPSQTCEADWVSGTSMIIRREVLQAVGLLDEGFYTYYDDIDFCYNARRAGWSTWYVSSSRVVHFQGQSTKFRRNMPYLFEARRRYFLKNHGPLYASLADAARIIGLSLSRLRSLLSGKPSSDPPYFLHDTIRHSVFMTGFRVKEVENPALKKTPVCERRDADSKLH